nr:hypothetical protein [Micromonospora sp. DSM 115978]
MDRDRAMTDIEQHQPATLWRLIRVRRCGRCRRRWPCVRYLDARYALVTSDRHQVAALIRRNSRWSTA